MWTNHYNMYGVSNFKNYSPSIFFRSQMIGLTRHLSEYYPAKTGEYPNIISRFLCGKLHFTNWKVNWSIWHEARRGTKKTLGPQQESNLYPFEHRVDALSTGLRERMTVRPFNWVRTWQASCMLLGSPSLFKFAIFIHLLLHLTQVVHDWVFPL